MFIYRADPIYAAYYLLFTPSFFLLLVCMYVERESMIFALAFVSNSILLFVVVVVGFSIQFLLDSHLAGAVRYNKLFSLIHAVCR